MPPVMPSHEDVILMTGATAGVGRLEQHRRA